MSPSNADRSAQSLAEPGEPGSGAHLHAIPALQSKQAACSDRSAPPPPPLHVYITTHNQINPVHRPKYQLPLRRKLNKNTEMIYGRSRSTKTITPRDAAAGPDGRHVTVTETQI